MIITIIRGLGAGSFGISGVRFHIFGRIAAPVAGIMVMTGRHKIMLVDLVLVDCYRISYNFINCMSSVRKQVGRRGITRKIIASLTPTIHMLADHFIAHTSMLGIVKVDRIKRSQVALAVITLSFAFVKGFITTCC